MVRPRYFVAVALSLAMLCCKQHAAFPEVRDINSVHITLRRSICNASCPSYTIEISGDGSVTYEGREDVAVLGTEHARIPPQKVRDLIELFRRADFYSLPDAYESSVSGRPYYTTILWIDGRDKKVVDYDGREVGMPASVTELEDAIDRAANSERWVGKR